MASISLTTFSDTFVFNESSYILVSILLTIDPIGSINNKPALVSIMVRQWTSRKPLSKPKMALFTDAYMRRSAAINEHGTTNKSSYNALCYYIIHYLTSLF